MATTDYSSVIADTYSASTSVGAMLMWIHQGIRSVTHTYPLVHYSCSFTYILPLIRFNRRGTVRANNA
jgi:hypothetical protein